MFNSIHKLNISNVPIQNRLISSTRYLNFNSVDKVSFKGASPSDYNAPFKYMASNTEPFKGTEAQKPKMISDSVLNYLTKEDNYKKPIEPLLSKNSFCSCYSEELKKVTIETALQTRNDIFNNWSNFINDGIVNSSNGDSTLVEPLRAKIKANPCLEFIIWSALSSTIAADNRHIPLPLDLQTLSDTIDYFENTYNNCADSKEKNHFLANKAGSASHFAKVYSSKLIENSIKEIINTNKHPDIKILDENCLEVTNPSDNIISDSESFWVVIPRVKNHNGALNSKNVNLIEKLSHQNWCTRSKSSMAENILKDGKFYVCIENNCGILTPKIGINSSKFGKLSKIQGERNDNTLDNKYFERFEKFLINTGNIKENGDNNSCEFGHNSEGPYIYNTYLTMKILNQNPELAQAIKTKDYKYILNYFNPKSNPQIDKKDGMFVIDDYSSSFNYKGKYTIPLSDFGIDEADLMKKIKAVNGSVNTKQSQLNNIDKIKTGTLYKQISTNLYDLLKK